MMGVFIFLIGLVIGSFINVLSVRVPLGLSIIMPLSRCDVCEQPIRIYDNIPLLSYFLLKGRCRDCGAKIGIMYPITEFSTGLVFLLVFIKFGFTYLLLKYLIFVTILIMISVTDIRTAMDDRFKTGVIPDVFLLLLIVYGLVTVLIEELAKADAGLTSSLLLSSLASFAFAYILLYIPSSVFRLLKGRDGLGDGDILLFAGISLLLVGQIPMVIILASSFGIIVWIVLMYILKRRDFLMPFAPFLSSGALAVILFFVHI